MLEVVWPPGLHRYESPEVLLKFTLPPEQKDVGPLGVITGAGQMMPYSVKSSKRNVPEPLDPESERTTEMVPVIPLIGFNTFVMPSGAPEVGIIPDPTEVPLIAKEKFCAPLVLLCLQKLNWVIDKLYPVATVKFKVIVGVPEELFNAIA